MNRFVRFGLVVLIAGAVYFPAHFIATAWLISSRPYHDHEITEFLPYPWGALVAMGFAVLLGCITLFSPGRRISKALEVAAIVSAVGFGAVFALIYLVEYVNGV